jgi:hypothetical protein
MGEERAMKLKSMLFTGALLAVATVAFAQVRTIPQIQQIQKIQPTNTAQPPSLELQTEEAVLRREMAQLKRDNERLTAENAALKAQVQGYTVLGGSLVHAYCSSDTVSMNTAGGSADCAASGYACDKVSGLCKTRCETGADCGGAGANCDVRSGRCIFGMPPDTADCPR